MKPIRILAVGLVFCLGPIAIHFLVHEYPLVDRRYRSCGRLADDISGQDIAGHSECRPRACGRERQLSQSRYHPCVLLIDCASVLQTTRQLKREFLATQQLA